MNKIRCILLDAVILFAISTVFVVVANFAFSGLKGKTPKDDPVVTAIVQGDAKELEARVQTGAAATGKTDEHGRTALMRAAYVNFSDAKLVAEADDKRVPMIAMLVAHGAPLGQQDHDGWTALMWASWSGMPKVVAKLLELGASHDVADHQGNTALTIAASRGNAEITRQLIAGGANKSTKTRAGKTALELAETGMREYPAKEKAYRKIMALLGWE